MKTTVHRQRDLLNKMCQGDLQAGFTDRIEMCGAGGGESGA